MSEMQNCVSFLRESLADARSCALLCIIHLEGSGFRGPGTCMVVDESGRTQGALSGGCLEGDLFEQARACMSTGSVSLVRYDTRHDENSVFSLRLGCDGVLHILIIPFLASDRIGGADHSLIAACQELAKLRSQAVLVLRCSRATNELPRSSSMVEQSICRIESATLLLHKSQCNDLSEDERIAAELSWTEDRSITLPMLVSPMMQTAELEAFTFCLCPSRPIQLSVYGAGSDAQSLVQQAVFLDWDVEVFDQSPIRATMSRFPGATRVHVATVEQCAAHVQEGPETACVIMSHNLDRDTAILREVLSKDVAFIGLLGTRERTAKILHSIHEQINVELNVLRERVHAPIGFDLGSETPQEIALSITSEILACIRRADGLSLRDRTGPIHRRRLGHHIQ